MPDNPKRSDRGYLIVPRGWFDEFEAEPFCKRAAKLWLLEHAAFKPRTAKIDGFLVELKRGQLCYSYTFLVERWRWTNVNAVRRFLANLEQAGAIIIENGTGRNIITICNYDEIQRGVFQNGTAVNEKSEDGTGHGIASGTGHGTAVNDLKQASETTIRNEARKRGTASGIANGTANGTNKNQRTQKQGTQKQGIKNPHLVSTAIGSRDRRSVEAAPADASGLNGDDLLLKLLAKRAGKFHVELSGQPPDWFPEFSDRVQYHAADSKRVEVWVEQLTGAQMESFDSIRTALNVRMNAYLMAKARESHQEGGTLQ